MHALVHAQAIYSEFDISTYVCTSMKMLKSGMNVSLTASTTVIFNALYLPEDLSDSSYENVLSNSFTETVSRDFSEAGNVAGKPITSVATMLVSPITVSLKASK